MTSTAPHCNHKFLSILWFTASSSRKSWVTNRVHISATWKSTKSLFKCVPAAPSKLWLSTSQCARHFKFQAQKKKKRKKHQKQLKKKTFFFFFFIFALQKLLAVWIEGEKGATSFYLATVLNRLLSLWDLTQNKTVQRQRNINNEFRQFKAQSGSI